MTSSSLTPCFHQELLTREQTFLYVALDLYIQLLRLFVERKDLLRQSPDTTEHVSEAQSLFFPFLTVNPSLYPFPCHWQHPSCSHIPVQGRGSLCRCLCRQAACSHFRAERSCRCCCLAAVLLVQDLRVDVVADQVICLTCE